MRISDWRSDVCSSALQLLAVLETGDVVRLDRGADRHRRHQLFLDDRLAPESRQCGVNIVDQYGEIGNGDAVVADVRCDNVGGQRNEHLIGVGLIGHETIPCFTQKRRSEAHTSELQSLMRISYAVLCLKTKHKITSNN